MHFRSFTTRGHSLITLTLALHELLITQSHSWLHWSRSHLRTLTQSLSPNHTRFISLGLPLALCRYCIAFITLIAIATLWSPLSNYSLALLVFPCLTSARVSWIYPLPYRSDSVCTSFGLLLCTWIISLCLAPVGYCSPIVDPRLP